MPRRNRIVLLILVLILAAVPYFFAAAQSTADWVFGGFLMNPLDGNTYLAKMQEGYAGRWNFSLTYSPQPTQGAPVFLFYLALGHLARLLGAPLLWVFHGARLVASLALLLMLFKLCERLFPDSPRAADQAAWLAALGSGVGWIGMLVSGQVGADWWVAEAYPFLSMFMNPHFPAGLALVIGMVLLDAKERTPLRMVVLAALGLLVASVQVFDLIAAAILLGLRFVWTWWHEKRFDPWNLCAGLALGGAYQLYQLWAITNDPLLAAWNRQNLTPTPPVWDLALSFSPALILALAGLFAARRQMAGLDRMISARLLFQLAGWLVLGLVLVYIPFNLQRRFLTGLYLPAALLAVAGLEYLRGRGFGSRWGYGALLGGSILTNLLLLLLLLAGVRSQAGGSGAGGAQLYLPRATLAALEWVGAHTPPDAVVLADTTSGLYVPAWSGRRTLYGHPFESANAAAEKQAVAQFYDGEMNAAQMADFLATRGVDFVLLTQERPEVNGRLVYESAGVRILEVDP
jgi:hypothetical protein